MSAFGRLKQRVLAVIGKGHHLGNDSVPENVLIVSRVSQKSVQCVSDHRTTDKRSEYIWSSSLVVTQKCPDTRSSCLYGQFYLNKTVSLAGEILRTYMKAKEKSSNHFFNIKANLKTQELASDMMNNFSGTGSSKDGDADNAKRRRECHRGDILQAPHDHHAHRL